MRGELLMGASWLLRPGLTALTQPLLPGGRAALWRPCSSGQLWLALAQPCSLPQIHSKMSGTFPSCVHPYPHPFCGPSSKDFLEDFQNLTLDFLRPSVGGYMSYHKQSSYELTGGFSQGHVAPFLLVVQLKKFLGHVGALCPAS